MIISPVLNNVLVGGVGSGNTYESIAIDEGFVLVDEPDEIVIEGDDDVIVFADCGVS